MLLWGKNQHLEVFIIHFECDVVVFYMAFWLQTHDKNNIVTKGTQQ